MKKLRLGFGLVLFILGTGMASAMTNQNVNLNKGGYPTFGPVGETRFLDQRGGYLNDYKHQRYGNVFLYGRNPGIKAYNNTGPTAQ